MTDLSLLDRYYPGLVQELEMNDDDQRDPSDIEIERSPLGDPVLKIRGFYIHSKRDPLREGKRQVEISIKEEQVGDGPLIILGFGLGYGAEAAVQAAPERPLIIVEKRRKILKLALELRNLDSLFMRGRIVFVLGGKDARIKNQIIEALSLFEKKAPCIIHNRALISLDEDWYGEAEKGIQSWITRKDVNRATLKRFGRRWVQNLSLNLSSIRDLPGINHLEGILKTANIPVFLVAAGPSLDKTGPLIPEIYQRCVVVSVDTSLRFLLERGIEADFVVSVDPQYLNYRHLERAFSPNTCLIAESAVYPPCLRHPFKGAFLCGSLFPLGRFIEERLDPKGAIGAGGSVATATWDFARILGATTIWIAGLDLSFPDLKTHFRGALFEDLALLRSFRFNPVETWSFKALRDGAPFYAENASGGKVLTDQRLSLYASWFENRFSLFPEIKNFSLSGEGLAIKGLEIAGEEALLTLPCRRDEIDLLLKNTFAKVNDDFSLGKSRRNEEYKNALSILLQGLKDIRIVSEEAADLADTFSRRFRKDMAKTGDEEKILKKLDSANKSISGSPVREVAGFLFPDTSELEKKISLEKANPLLRHLEFSKYFYLALAEATEINYKVLTQL